jgi:glycosyltransferase involved in cell wall biosynthesis
MSLLSDIRVFFELLSIVRRERPDVLHVTSSKAGGIGAFVGHLARVSKIIFTSHGLAYDEAWRPRWQRALIWFASWCTFALSTKTIQITHDTFTRASRMPFLRSKMVLVHNGRDMPTFLSREDARKKLCRTEGVCGERWVGTIAELTPNKNLHVLIEAVAHMHKNGLRAHIWILGEGEEKATLAKLSREKSIEQYTHLLGHVPNAASYLKSFDVFTLPSRKEGLPYVLLEAGQAGLPVVASNIPGISDIITHGETGMMLEAIPEKLAEAYTTLLEDKALALRYGSSLKNFVSKNFSIPENSTISSNFLIISKRFIPKIAPLRKIFSRPVNSG